MDYFKYTFRVSESYGTDGFDVTIHAHNYKETDLFMADFLESNVFPFNKKMVTKLISIEEIR